VLHAPDAILLLGLVVAREMGWPAPAALRVERTHFAALNARTVQVECGVEPCLVALDHDAEKWEPAFGLHHGPTN
jgi:hypothetical protein